MFQTQEPKPWSQTCRRDCASFCCRRSELSCYGCGVAVRFSSRLWRPWRFSSWVPATFFCSLRGGARQRMKLTTPSLSNTGHNSKASLPSNPSLKILKPVLVRLKRRPAREPKLPSPTRQRITGPTIVAKPRWPHEELPVLKSVGPPEVDPIWKQPIGIGTRHSQLRRGRRHHRTASPSGSCGGIRPATASRTVTQAGMLSTPTQPVMGRAPRPPGMKDDSTFLAPRVSCAVWMPKRAA